MDNDFKDNQPEDIGLSNNQNPAQDNQYQINPYHTDTNQIQSNTNNEGSIYSYTGSSIIQDDYQVSVNKNSYQYYNQDSHGFERQTGDPYIIYPSPNVVEELPKAKKKKRFGAFAKLVAAAMVFGIIAGGVFQGYYLITASRAVRIEEESDADLLQVTEYTDTDATIPTSTSSGKVVSDVSDVVEKVMPSIVAINSTAKTKVKDFFGRQFEQEASSSGSGIIIAHNGSKLLIVTNNHVVNSATSIEIKFSDGTTAKATVKGSDANADLAVLSVDMDQLSEETASKIKVATIGNSDDMVPGDMVIAIGNALGYGQSVTVGYVSAVDREITIEGLTLTLLQTDAAINPGNSGGALLNIRGEVIGINSVKFAAAQIEGMGYAIPISSAIPMINELMNRELVAESERGYLGIDISTAKEVTDAIAKRFNMPIGIYINDVIEGSPAEAAGLMQGDIITGLDGFKIETIEDLRNALSYKKAGQAIELRIQTVEGGAYTDKVLNVTLGKK
jgi:serine protease Do